MTLTVIQDPRLLAWFDAKSGARSEPLRCRWVAGFDEHGVIFVVVYKGFSERNCEMAIETDGTKRWASKRSLRLIFSQPFRTWGLARVTFICADDNVTSKHLVQRLGAKEEGTLREAFARCSGKVYSLLKTEAERWLK